MSKYKRTSNFAKLCYGMDILGFILIMISYWAGDMFFVIGLAMLAIATILLDPFGWIY